MARFTESTDPAERLAFFSDGTALVIRYSMLTGKFNKTLMQMTKEQYELWRNKKVLIQDALPQLDAEQREFLMTGYTPEDWVNMFPPKEDGE